MSRAVPRRVRTMLVASILTVLASSGPLGATTTAGAAPATSAASSTTPWVGLLEPSTAQANALVGSAVGRVMVPAGWDSIEPQQGSFNPWALRDLKTRVATMQKKGFEVVLDLGLQYPPAWVFSLPGQTRFVNQYGETWTGTGLSTAVPNAVFNQQVRQAEANYIRFLGRALGPLGIVSVRVGGMLTGELRYPPADADGHTDAMWFYDAAAQAAAPVPGWRPGTGTAAQTKNSLNYYFSSLNRYLGWQMRTIGQAFPGSDQQVLFPSWGLRPGMLEDATAKRMSATDTPPNVLGIIASGLDWEQQIQTMAASGVSATVYCTWVDAPSYGSSATGMSPLRYLAQLAQRYGLPVAGENTGRGGVAALQSALDSVADLHLDGVMYMSGHLITDGSAGLSIAQFRNTVNAWRAAAGSP